jgi:hypothetical protein
MIRMARLAGIGAILTQPLLFAGSAQALNLVSFLSLSGGGSACTFQSPCAAFSVALDATEPSGQIRCLDSYGTNDLTITKPITFDCEALILTTANAITINIDRRRFRMEL